MQDTYDALRYLLDQFLKDLKAGTLTLDPVKDTRTFTAGPWRGLDKVTVSVDIISFWIDKETLVDVSTYSTSTDLADKVQRIWYFVGGEFEHANRAASIVAESTKER